jgi:ABC-type multidrug transport system fused ATPase/permease subunit
MGQQLGAGRRGLATATTDDTPAERINTGAVLSRLLRYLAPFRTQLIGALALVIISAATQAAGPALIGVAIDSFIVHKDPAGLTREMLLLLAIYIVGFGAQAGQTYLIGTIGQRFLSQLRTEIFDKVQVLPVTYFDKNQTGDLMSRLVNDIQTINQLLSQGFTQVVGSIFSLIGIIIAMFVLNLQLALVSFVTIPLMIWVTYIFAQRSRIAFRLTRTALGDVSSELEEELTGIRVAQAYNRTGTNIRQFAERNAANRDANVQAVAITSAFTPTIDVLSTLATAIVAAFGGWLALNNQLAVGVVVAFFIYVQQFFRPIQIISNIYTQMQSALAGAERIFDLVDEPQQQLDTPGAQTLPPIKGHINLVNVDFSYNGKRSELVLSDINLEVEAGKTIALVGETGAGKSTLVNLLPRFYDPLDGVISIDGYDTHNVTMASLRRQLGFVQQDTYLFSGTIADNIRYGRLDATDAEVEAAARTANVHDVIMALPQGYQTKLGERGSGLSQGQRQLLSFARTLLADTPVLILDEATSNIDTRTEALIQDALQRLLLNRTAIIIAHRLSTIRNADLVIVIDQGRIPEKGTHAELLARNGRYAELYHRQFP